MEWNLEFVFFVLTLLIFHQDDQQTWLCVCVSTRSISNWGSEEGLGVSQQHRSLLAAAWADNPAHPGIWDQILREGKVSPWIPFLHAWTLSFMTEPLRSGFSNRNTSNWATRQRAPRLRASSSPAWNQRPGTFLVCALAQPLDTAHTLPNMSMKLPETVSIDWKTTQFSPTLAPSIAVGAH